MIGSQNGVTLIELIVVLSIISILAAISAPNFAAWRQQEGVRNAAYSVVATMNQARRDAIAQKLEHQVEFNVAANQYRLVRGNRAARSTSFNTVVMNWSALDSGTALRINNDCLGTNNINFTFSPLGTVASDGATNDVCIMRDPMDGSALTPGIRVSLASPTTGRIVMEKP